MVATVRSTRRGGAILRVSEIAEGVLQAMFMTKFKTTVAVFWDWPPARTGNLGDACSWRESSKMVRLRLRCATTK